MDKKVESVVKRSSNDISRREKRGTPAGGARQNGKEMAMEV